MRYWLMKSEPEAYPWSKLVADGRGHWDGVRNHQAKNNLMAMKVGDRAFFYHSGEGRQIVGTVPDGMHPAFQARAQFGVELDRVARRQTCQIVLACLDTSLSCAAHKLGFL